MARRQSINVAGEEVNPVVDELADAAFRLSSPQAMASAV